MRQEPLRAGEAATVGSDGVALSQRMYEQLTSALSTLPDKPEEDARSAFRALWLLAGGVRVSAVGAIETPLMPLELAQRERFQDLVTQRLSGTPLAHLTGRQRFMGIEMLASPAALIPRRETEIVGDAALHLARTLADAQGAVRVLDVCTGSGNLAAAIAAREPRAAVFASDISANAVALAQQNVAYVGVRDRVTVRQGDLFAAFDTPEHVGAVDLVTCNPPYISSERAGALPPEIANHEPSVAFDGGPLGVRILMRLISEAPRLLRPGGWLAFEVGLGQGESVARRMTRSGAYATVDSFCDGDGNVRALAGQTPIG